MGWSAERLPPQINRPNPLPTVCCDPVLISDVFGNLISNAAKYTDQERANIEVGWLLPEDYLEQGQEFPLDPTIVQHLTTHQTTVIVFYIKDSGIGIRERHFQNIFKLFKRLHERDRYGGGSGVGLTITQRIIERHNGHIWVESVYGEGTTFYFTLKI